MSQVEKLFEVLQTYLHLKWIYEDDTSSLDLDMAGEQRPLMFPSEQELTKLYDMVKIGDLSSLKIQLMYLTDQAPEYTPFAMRITSLANELQFDKIQAMLEER